MSVEVPTKRLDDFAFGPIGFIKIDVEGHELSVLEGGAGVISRERPTVLVEVEERHKAGALASVRSFFETRGFDGFFIFDGAIKRIDELTRDMQAPTALEASVPRKRMLYVNNFIFVPREKAPAFRAKMQDALDGAASQS